MQENKIPLLGDIPIIEHIFKFTSEETVNSEVVVFITPWIVDQPVLDESEKEILKQTEFKGPCPATSRGETESQCLKS